eukprot:1139685-Pelagomonas_calceolata.AAC.1
MNATGGQLVELANVSSCVLGTGRDCLGSAHVQGMPGQKGGSRPDHVVMPGRLLSAAEQVDVEEVCHISDHCTMSVGFQMSATGLTNADCAMNCDHQLGSV